VIGRSVARRYLAASLEAAERAGLRDELGRQLTRLRPITEAAPELVRLLAHPTMRLERKLAAVERLLGEPLVAPLRDLVALLIDNDRLKVLRAAADVYQELVDEAQGVVRAHVTTAMPLPDDQAERLRAALRGWLDADVVLDPRVDPQTIGGIVVAVGDRTLDGSLRGRLQRIRARIVAD